MAAFATGARHELSYILEVTPGTTPATPAMKRLRHTGTSLQLSTDTLSSDELYSDPFIRDNRHGNRRAQGDVDFELSYGAFDDWLSMALFGTWATNVLKAGSTLKTATVERRFTDIAVYPKFLGMAVNNFSLSIVPNRIVTGTFGLLGMDATPAGATLGAPTDVATNPPFDSFSGTLSEGGSVIAIVTALALTMDNGLDPAFVVGSPIANQVIPGRRGLTGRLSCYFDSATLYNKFLNETESSLSLTLVSTAGTLTLLIPRIKYNAATINLNGDRGIIIDMPFQALRDPTLATNFQITK